MNQQNNSYKVLGLMSGTSLDGLDLCLTEFKQVNNGWDFRILASETVSYSNQWEDKLRHVENESGDKLSEIDFSFGKLLGELSLTFLDKLNFQADFIASHGHTIFHQIDKGFTTQIGHGAAIAANSGLSCISDFRSLDVALGGQGAPLVPFGDQHLFSEYKACINLGGIANISFQQNNQRIAFDICAVNMVLNHFMLQFRNEAYDEDGLFSSSGKVDYSLLEKLNSLPYFKTEGPKSLGKEWVFEKLIPLIEKKDIPLENKLRTFTEHVAEQINTTLLSNKIRDQILFTGGGSKNKLLINRLKSKGLDFKLPSENIIDFKEALIFAFLGLNRFLEHTNTLKSVTGASKDSCGGTIYLAL